MDRRAFLRNSLLTYGGIKMPGGLWAAEITASKSGGKRNIQYVRQQIPSFEPPVNRGQSYEDDVPDTLDIAEQAKLAIHAMTSITDPDADEEIFWFVDIFRNPPIMRHDFSDWVQVCEGFMEALPLLRIATGDTLNDHIDAAWMRVALKSLGPDGLYYIPFGGRPWCRYNYVVGALSETDPVWRPDGSTTKFVDPSIAQITTGEVCARALPTLAVYYLRDRNPMWKEAGQRMVRRITEIAVKKDDYSYVSGAWEPNAKVGRNAEMPLAFVAEEWNGRLIQGLAQFYQATGYEPALELAGRVTKFYRYHSKYYDPQGRFIFDPRMQQMFKQIAKAPAPTIGGHGHAHQIGLLAMLEYATAAGDHETMEYVRASYEWIKQQNSPFGVSTLVGWFPEWYVSHFEDCETCPIADMLGLAINLSKAGLGDYWDDLDRWVRNQFSAQQITPDLVQPIYRFAETQPHKPLGPFETSDRVVERNVGAWSGWAGPTDWAIKLGIQHCCTGSASRSLYYVWENMLTRKGDELRVNLLANRASKWADVYSYVPYQGRVDFNIKEACGHVAVRAPQWVASQSPEIKCTVNGASRSLRWENRYVDLGAVRKGDKATVTFPIAERTLKEWIGPGSYTVVLKGNTVVAIDPPGRNVPIYQDRAKYRKADIQWRKVKRFVPAEQISW